MFLSVMTKNLNWEILTKDVVTLKRWAGVKDGGGGGHEKPIYREELSKNGALNSLQI